ncbi:hypothetical protein [Winogradskyella wichelsiae]|uniref:hypothetical protein n=1 Tax=Winogradskyella wichelsiae TaxID=2697007 RepID=UPI0015C70853|nr:hypothetical protein [Winogradskyella wichelsiae]
MKIRFVILILSCILVTNCDDDSKSDATVDTIVDVEENSRITAKTIENIDYKDFVLSPESKEAILSWGEYQELLRQLSFLKRGDFSFFDGDKETLKKFITDFKKGLPSEFSTNPILSRNAIIETELLKLNENLTLDNIERKEKIASIKGLFIAFSNLNDMINKKLERDMYNKILPE